MTMMVSNKKVSNLFHT